MILDEHVLKTPRHETFYLASGPREAPLIIFAHGWPELSLSWRHQLKHFGERGWRAIAPDMRGDGRSTVHRRHEDYALEESAADMLELLAHLGREQAIWVGHDWGSPFVDRELYPAEQYPVGQWDYQFFYLESFDKARTTFEANVRNTVKALCRRG